MRIHTDSVGAKPRLTGGLALFIVSTTILLALPRFAHTTPDSLYYTDLVAYFRGTLPREALHTPFAFRWVVPRVAALLSGLSPGLSIALVNVSATIAAYLLATRLFARLLTSQRQLILAAFLLVVSFPTINYGSAVLTDAAGFLILVSACYAMQGHRFLLLAIVMVVGTGVRESTVLMVPVLWIFYYLVCAQETEKAPLLGGAGGGLTFTRAPKPTPNPSKEGNINALASPTTTNCKRQDASQPHWVIAATGISAITVLAALASRWYFTDLPAYFWTPSWERFVDNMTRPVSWATVALTLAPLLVACAVTGRTKTPLPRELRAFIIAIALPGLLLIAFSTTAAFMSGRFCWPLYLALIPLSAWRLAPARGNIPPVE